MLTMDDVDLNNKTVLIREDFNVPMKNGKITHTARIDAALPTIKQAIQKGAKIILMSHLGRPEEGQYDPDFSLKPIADYLGDCLNLDIIMFPLDQPPTLEAGQVALLENVRFLSGEQEDDPQLAKKLAALCDVFVMDAFAVAHRAQASTHGVIKFAKVAVAGPLLNKELQAINKITGASERPVVAIVGGSKVSTKLDILTNLLDKVDILVVGGGIANTFLSALGSPIGSSLFEPELVATAKALWEKAQKQHKTIWLPTDVIVTEHISDDAQGVVKTLAQVAPTDKIVDIGPESQADLAKTLIHAKTILWNGPVGIFEIPAFAKGTESLARAIAQSPAFSVAGGGDTLAAIEQFQVGKDISYLSTGGGAFLEALEGKTLPGVAALLQRDPIHAKTH